MLNRFVAILAMLAVTLVTTAASAHAARMNMSDGSDHMMQAGGMMHSVSLAQPDDQGEQDSDLADVAMCDFVCSGISIGLAPPVVGAALAYRPAPFDLSMSEILVGQSPDLKGHPPKLRLL